jgi:hypothetical protein
MDRMYVEFTGLGPDEDRADAAQRRRPDPGVPARAVGRLLGLGRWPCAPARSTTPSPCSRRATITLRLGVNLWIRGDLMAWRGLAALALARRALGGGKVRSLTPVELDLMLAASFEVTKVFNAITADPDTRRLRDLTNNLGKNLPRRQRRPLLRICQALSSTHFEPAATARATLSTDLRMALLLSGDVSGCLVRRLPPRRLRQRQPQAAHQPQPHRPGSRRLHAQRRLPGPAPPDRQLGRAL